MNIPELDIDDSSPTEVMDEVSIDSIENDSLITQLDYTKCYSPMTNKNGRTTKVFKKRLALKVFDFKSVPALKAFNCSCKKANDIAQKIITFV